MLAFVLQDGPPTLVRNWLYPEAHDGLVRVRTLIAGICNTDLELARGYMGFRGVLGHEFVGEALEGRFAGKRVVGGINFGCGECSDCAAGRARHCVERRVLGILGADGVLGEAFLIPEDNLVEVPASVSDEIAVFCEPVAAACEILEQVGSVEHCRVLVIGDGKLGLLIAQVLAAEGARVTLEGRHTESVSWIRAANVDLSRPTSRYDLVVEATGSREGLAHAIELTRPRGTLVLKTTVAGTYEVDLSRLVIDEITVIGSRCGQMAPALERLTDGRVQVESMISGRYSLKDVEEAFAFAGRHGVRKVLVRVC